MDTDDVRNAIEELAEQLRILSERESAHYTDIMLTLKELVPPEPKVSSFDDVDDELYAAEKHGEPKVPTLAPEKKKRERKAKIAKEPESEIFPKDNTPNP